MTTRIVPPDPNQPPEGGEPTRIVPTGDLPLSSQPTQQVPVVPSPPTVPLDPTGAMPATPWATPAGGVAVPPTPPAAYVTPPPVVAESVTTTTVRRSAGPLPWILGGVAALVLVGLLALLLNRNNGAVVVTVTATPAPVVTSSETPTVEPSATALVVVVTATALPATDTATPAPATETATPLPTTATPLPATATATVSAPPATATPIPGLPTVTVRPTVTPLPATATPLPPTATPLPPTATPLPPTATPLPAIATQVPATALLTASPTPPTDPLTGGSPTLQPLDTMTPFALPSVTGTPPAPVGGPPADVAPVEATEGYLTVQWFGQSAFLLAAGEGTRLLIDPVGPDFGYHLPFIDPLDAVLLSHLHPDHTYTQVAPGSVSVFPGLDTAGHFRGIHRAIKGVAIRTVNSSHDDAGGKTNGENAIWVIDMDGFHIVHLGDLGQTSLTQKQLGEIGKPDILMIPVGGGGFTIDGPQAQRIVGQLKPALVIPMHYQTDRTPATLPLQPVSGFLGSPALANAPNSVRLKRSDLPTGAPRVLVLNYK
ncbi:MAG: MBL fold metallo-hydrolase [Chloroflexota bacterium]|nr:MBL fold metallo-hydrolase [Chloroflexota bacterium]